MPVIMPRLRKIEAVPRPMPQIKVTTAAFLFACVGCGRRKYLEAESEDSDSDDDSDWDDD